MIDHHRERLAGTIYVLAAIAKVILARISPVAFLILRLGIGAAILIIPVLRRPRDLTIQRGDLTIVLGAGIIGIILHQLVQVQGLRWTSATNTGWILTLIPPLTGILGWMFLRERARGRQVVGLLVAMIGVLFFAAKGRPQDLSFVHNRGDLLALASVFTWAVYTVMMKSRLARYSPTALAALHMILGFVFFLLLGIGNLSSEAATLTTTEWLIVILIGAVPSGLAYAWWNAGLKRLSAIDTSMFLFIEAIVASLAAYVILAETVTITMVAWAAVIVGGVWYAQHPAKRRASGT
jgi:drug/metabolite transporter (DMT)-like permease